MLTLLLLLLMVWVVLVLLVTAWSLFFQGYLYTEPTPGMAWRGPLAGSIMTLVIVLWVLLAYRSPDRFRPLWEFSSSEDTKFFPELRVPVPGGREDVYKLRPGTRGDYRLDGLTSGRPLPTRPPEIVVMEEGQRAVFRPEKDEKGNFKQRTTTGFGRESREPLRYRDESGRMMQEDSLGQLTRFKGGVFFGNILLNLLLFAAMFLPLWLLVEFQWPHALGHAVVLWLILLLFVFPPLLSRAEAIGRERATAQAAP